MINGIHTKDMNHQLPGKNASHHLLVAGWVSTRTNPKTVRLPIITDQTLDLRFKEI